MKSKRNEKLLTLALVLPLTLVIMVVSPTSAVLASKTNDPASTQMDDSTTPIPKDQPGSPPSSTADPVTVIPPRDSPNGDQPVTIYPDGQQQQQQPQQTPTTTPTTSDPNPQQPATTTPQQEQTPAIEQGQIGVVKGKGNTLAQQQCAGVQSSFECNQIIKNIHNTTVKGSNVLIGTPVAATNGATPVVLYVPGVGYVELTGIQNAGNGQATINYVVLVPSK